MTGQRKERPILFNAEMVNAILNDRKTQTRRIVKCNFQDIGFNHDMGQEWPWSEDCEHAEDYWHPCPLGKPGDQLWVRETFGQYRAAPSGFVYRADDELSCGDPDRWTPSIHMPRRASRINLLITGVRVEQLNDISEQDAKAEGAQQYDISRFTTDEINLLDTPLNNLDTPYTNGFALLWESCYGSGSWAANPFVWVIDFEKTN